MRARRLANGTFLGHGPFREAGTVISREHVITIKRSLAITYASQLYMALVGLVILPFYLEAVGLEAYGLIAFYIALQSWLRKPARVTRSFVVLNHVRNVA